MLRSEACMSSSRRTKSYSCHSVDPQHVSVNSSGLVNVAIATNTVLSKVIIHKWHLFKYLYFFSIFDYYQHHTTFIYGEQFFIFKFLIYYPSLPNYPHLINFQMNRYIWKKNVVNMCFKTKKNQQKMVEIFIEIHLIFD